MYASDGDGAAESARMAAATEVAQGAEVIPDYPLGNLGLSPQSSFQPFDRLKIN